MFFIFGGEREGIIITMIKQTSGTFLRNCITRGQILP